MSGGWNPGLRCCCAQQLLPGWGADNTPMKSCRDSVSGGDMALLPTKGAGAEVGWVDVLGSALDRAGPRRRISMKLFRADLVHVSAISEQAVEMSASVLPSFV